MPLNESQQSSSGSANTTDVDVVSSALPTGAATSAAQTDGSQVSQALFDLSNMSAFGTLETAELTPIFQSDFVFGLNSQLWKQSYVFTITSPETHPVLGDQYSNSNQIFTIIESSGTTLLAYGTGNPAASGDLTRVTGSGTTPIAYSAYAVKAGVTNGTGATIDTNAARLRVQSGTAATGYAHIQPRRPIRYRAGQGQVARFTCAFTAGVADNVQLMGVGNTTDGTVYDGFFFGYNGTSFGIVHYVRGEATWYTRTADWNGDKCDGSAGSSFTWNPALGNVVMIKYPYLGFGNVTFWVQHPTTSRWVLAHTIRYTNTVATTELSNPTLAFLAFTLNSGNTTNVTMYSGSVGVFISGAWSFSDNPNWSAATTLASVTTEANIITLRNANTFNGTTNRGLIRITDISVSSSAANGGAIFRLKVGATVGGTPSFAAISGATADNGGTITAGNSITSWDIAGTTIAGGSLIYSIASDNPNTVDEDLVSRDIFLAPGEILTISAFSTNASTVGVAINWTEDI